METITIKKKKGEHSESEIPPGFVPCAECLKQNSTLFYTKLKIKRQLISKIKAKSSYVTNSIPLCQINLTEFKES